MKKRMFCAILLFVFAAAFLWAMPAAAEKLQVEWEGTAYVVDTNSKPFLMERTHINISWI